jgi:hypothetical protein
MEKSKETGIIENSLDNFISDEKEKLFKEKVKADKVKFMKQSTELVERYDKIVVDESGRQLLNEVY